MRALASLTACVCGLALSACGRIGYDLLDPASDGLHAAGGSVPGNVPDGASPGGGPNAGGTSASDSGSVGGSSSGGASSSGGRAGSGGTAINVEGGTGAGGASGSGGSTTAVDGGAGGTSGTGGTSSTGGAGGGSGIIDVTNPTQTVRSGSAQLGTGELDVTTETRNVAGSAFLPSAYALTSTTSFSVNFSFKVTSLGPAADGFAIVLQNDPRGASALGDAGGALGYGGTAAITPSVDVEFDLQQNTYDVASNEIAITTNGQFMTYVARAASPFGIADGFVHYAWIEYGAVTKTVSAYVSNTPVRPATALTSANIDLYATLGGTAYLGFTAGTGASDALVAILSLSVSVIP